MKSSIKIILRYFLLFIESLMFIMIALITTFKFTLLDSNYVENEFAKNNYYKKLSKEIKTEMSYYTNQSGFEDSVLDNVFTENDVKYAFERFVNSIYIGEKFSINTQKLEDNLNKNIDEALKDTNFKVTNAEEIDKFVKQMITTYENEIKLMGYIDSVRGVVPKIIDICDTLLLILVVAFTICIAISIKVFRGRDLSIIFYTSAFLLVFFVLFIKNSIDINNISIYSELVSNIIKALVKNVLNIIGIVACSSLGVGLITDILRKERRHHHHHHHRSSHEEV